VDSFEYNPKLWFYIFANLALVNVRMDMSLYSPGLENALCTSLSNVKDLDHCTSEIYFGS